MYTEIQCSTSEKKGAFLPEMVMAGVLAAILDHEDKGHNQKMTD